MERRSFLKLTGGIAGSYALGIRPGFGMQVQQEVPKRVLGRTGDKLSIVAFPGLAVGQQMYDQKQCTEGLHKAFGLGINYFDVAPAYGKDGLAEIRMGIGMQGIRRDNYFLACKTKARDAKGAQLELERSLKRLKTDYFDLYQMHHLRWSEEVDKAFGPDGCMEFILKAQKQGKIRHIGFSAHTTKSALSAMNQFKFDSVMFPINFVEYYKFGFGKEVLALAQQQGAGVLAIKAMSAGAWKKEEPRKRKWWYKSMESQRHIELSLRFVWSLENVVSGFTPSFLDLAEKAAMAAMVNQKITQPELDELKKIADESLSVFESHQNQEYRADASRYEDNGHMECCMGMMA